jgi:hypothetical protein
MWLTNQPYCIGHIEAVFERSEYFDLHLQAGRVHNQPRIDIVYNAERHRLNHKCKVEKRGGIGWS